MNVIETPQGRRLDLYVRSLSPSGARAHQEAVLDRLTRLEAAGHIAGFTVHVWGKQVNTTTAAARTDAGRFILDRVSEFREWARRNGRSLGSFFETRDVASTITGEEYTTLVLPTMTLAEYRDGTLDFVTPCTDGEVVYTVHDRLDRLDAGDTDAGHPARRRSETEIVADE